MASAATTAQLSENSELITSLHTLQAKSKKLVRSSTYPAPADPSIEVRSWKMNEFKYYDVPSPFPTLVRGLFTREIPDDSQKEREAAGSKTSRTCHATAMALTTKSIKEVPFRLEGGTAIRPSGTW